MELKTICMIIWTMGTVYFTEVLIIIKYFPLALNEIRFYIIFSIFHFCIMIYMIKNDANMKKYRYILIKTKKHHL